MGVPTLTTPPTGFTDLATAYNAPANTFINVIGVVVDHMAPVLTRRDWLVTMKLLDPRLRDAVYGNRGMTARFFRSDEDHLPKVRHVGDIVLIRNIKVQPFKNQPALLSNIQTTVVTFPMASIPDPSFQIAYQGTRRLTCEGAPRDAEQVTSREQSYVIALKHDLGDVADSLPGNSVPLLDPVAASFTAQAVPPAKRQRLSEPSLSGPSPPIASTGHAAERSRLSDGVPQRVARTIGLPSVRSSKLKTVKELQHYQFADICAEVVKRFSLPNGDCDLYVTDYTPNEDMWYYTPPEEDRDIERDGDMFGYAGGPPKRHFPGPFGWLVLKVNVKHPHSDFVNQKVAEADFVLLRNVKMKYGREGGKLEGDLFADYNYPDKVQVSKLSSADLEEIQAILHRKEKYWASRKAKIEHQDNQDLSRAEKRKKRKKKAAEKRAAEAGALDALLKERGEADVNPHVRCSHEEVPISFVKDIVDTDDERHTNNVPGGTSYVLPFISAKYRARVRVVDYEPKALEDFSVLEEPDDDDKSVSSVDMDWQTTPKYRWSFNLLLEDASMAATGKDDPNLRHRLWAFFDHESAQYLLGNSVDDPADLRQDTHLLAQLREKLCILWGNLEEKDGHETLSNRPFECCIEEHGIEMDDSDPAKVDCAFGYARVYGMFGVTIT